MRKKVEKKAEKEIAKGEVKKDSLYAWISLMLALFFLVPLINLVALPASIFFGAKAIRNSRKEPEKYGGKWMAVVSVVFSSVSFVFSLMVLFMYITGRIG